MKKNNTTEKTIRNAEKLAQALKEGTEKTLQSLVNEAISKLILEGEEEPVETDDEDVVDDNSFDEEDVDVENDSEVEDEIPSDEDVEEAPESDEEGEDDEWSDFDEFKTDDNDYDFTGEDENIGEKLLQIFNKIDDGDQIIVTKSGDEVKVSEVDADAEEVIELDSEDNDDDVESVSDDEFELEFDDEDEESEGDEFNGEENSEDDEEFEFEFDDEDSDDELEESIDYTTTYQKKTAMTTPSNKEVANPKDTYSMDDVPEGDDRRYGKGVGCSEPFCESEDLEADMGEEIDEATNVGGAVQQRSASKSKIPAGRKTYVPKGTKHASFGSEYKEVVESLEAIKAENKALKECLNKHVKCLREAAVLNVNLGKVIRLLSEETTTRDEKKSILTRFNNVKSINEGTALYETIKGELKESKKSTVNLSESIAVGEKKNLNETTLFNRNDNPSLGLMDRMDNLYKK